jgi:hypothetical protein
MKVQVGKTNQIVSFDAVPYESWFRTSSTKYGDWLYFKLRTSVLSGDVRLDAIEFRDGCNPKLVIAKSLKDLVLVDETTVTISVS